MEKLSLYIKDPFRILSGVLRRMAPWISNDELYLRILFFLKQRKVLHLKNPQTFSEKLQWLKLYDRKPEYTTMVDKYAVKEYVANIIGEEYIIPTIGVWDKPEDIDWDSLPDKFVLKTTHGGGSVGVVVCKDKNSFNKEKAIHNLSQSLKQNIYTELREWPYKDVKKRIIAEPFMEDFSNNSQDLPDFKFFCFNGNPIFCQVIKDRNTKETVDFFDKEWQHQSFQEPKNYPFSSKTIQAPSQHSKMLELASKLSKGHPFLRVDFYEVNGKVYFGELTFFPTSGFGGFNPEKWNNKFGSWIQLPEKI